jgi:UDP-glucuronate decarboxylase
MRHYETRKRIMVTRGVDILGSHLGDRLLARGHGVLCADNIFTGTKRDVEHLHDSPRFDFMRHDGPHLVVKHGQLLFPSNRL